MMRFFARLAVFSVASLALAAIGGPAFATFPGTNGLIAFSTGGDGSDPAVTSQIFTVRAD